MININKNYKINSIKIIIFYNLYIVIIRITQMIKMCN